jgi:transcriptional regulator with XRE-family HTH domain
MSIGKQLKNARLSAGLTQIQLSKASGVSQGAITAYENDLQNPTAEKLASLAKALGVPMETLLDPEAIAQTPEPDNRLHGNSGPMQTHKIVLQLSPEAQKAVLQFAKALLLKESTRAHRQRKKAA